MPASTLETQYAERLRRRADAPWKRLLDVQRPYRRNLQRLKLGRVLDVGCGVGRNLRALDPASVGVDNNASCVAFARARGFAAYTPEEFFASEHAQPESFDALLCAHVLEHLDPSAGEELLRTYLPLLKADGRVVAITPQEAGFASDETHATFVDFAGLRRIGHSLGLRELRAYSFPFPRWAGRIFPYNEFVFMAAPDGTLK